MRYRKRLGRSNSNHQGACQPWTIGDRNRVDLTHREIRVFERLSNGGLQRLEVSPCGDLGHNTAELRMLIHGAVKGICKKSIALDYPDSSFIAGAFNAQNNGLLNAKPHHQGIHPGGLIVVFSDVNLLKSKRAIKPYCGIVINAHLEEHCL